jgi:hypothetical protein
MAAHRQPAVGAEPILAAVDGRAAGACGDPRHAQDRYGLALSERGLERAKLAVDLTERAQLREHERVVSLAEAMQVEDQATEVAIGELAGLAQKARTAAQAAARPEARRLGARLGAGGRVLLRSGRGWRCGSRG